LNSLSGDPRLQPVARNESGGLDGAGIAKAFVRAFPDVALLVFDPQLKVALAIGPVPAREGVPAPPVGGSRCSEVLAPAHWDRCAQLFGSALDGESGCIEIDELDGQGAFAIAVEPLRDAANVVVGGVCVWRERTERRQLDEELEQRDRLLDLAHDAVIVREPVTSAVTYWNRVASEIYGYTAAEARGRITHELLATEFSISQEAVDEALHTHGRWEGELRHRRVDGQRIVVSSRQALVRNDRGEPTAIIELNSDITERQRAERDLRDAEQRFRGLIESAPDAMVIADEQDTIVLVNAQAEELFGYSRAELIGQPARLVLPAGLRPRLLQDRKEYMDEPGTLRIDLGLDRVARRKDGREFATEIGVSPLRTDRGLLISASVRDVSQQLLRQLEQALVPRLRIGPRWKVAWRYRPAVRAMLLAGDFIGAAERPDGSLALLIGDVSGHGPAAAGTSATLRAAWLGASQSDLRIESIPGLLHRLLVAQAERAPVALATACLAEIDPSGSEMRLIRAGHDSPLLITRDAVNDLSTTYGPALGLPGPGDWPLEELPLPQDAAIMLYTDGLTELRSRGSIRRFEELAPRIDAARTLDQPPGQALDHLLTTTFPAGTEELDDDVAVILLNLSRTPPLDGTDPDHTEHRMTDDLAPLVDASASLADYREG
jgi:PAS domain S-box-containing protein